MTDLVGTVWQSNSNSSRYVRVIEHGEHEAFVAACSAEGKVWYTLSGGGLRSRMTKVALVGGGTRLSRYTQVQVPA